MKEIILYGIITEGRLLLDRQKVFEAFLKSVKKSTRVELILGPLQKDKTTQQLRYYFGVVIPAMIETTGYTKEECDGILKKMFLTMNKNSPKEYIKEKTNLSIQEFSEFLDSVILFLTEQGIWVPCCNEFDIKRKST